MAKSKLSKTNNDNGYLLKIILFMILGSLWVKTNSTASWLAPIPIGFIVGIIFARHEHFKIDRKIEYAILLITMLIGFWAPIGLFVYM